jgi:RNA polymerase sigma-70 factor (ECF subfamily)
VGAGAEDRELIGASVREPARFAEIFDRHFAAVHRFVDRRLGRDAADSLAGEVFRIAFEQRDRYDRARPSCLPWLYGITNNLVLKEYRRRGRHLRAVGRLGRELSSPDGTAEIDARVDAHAAWPGVAAALAQLSDGDRDVLLLVAWEDLSYEEVADALEIPIGTVRSRLHRARSRVRELIERPGEERDDQDVRVPGRGRR